MANLAEFPENLTDFEERFATEAACVAYARNVKWPDGFRCSSCGGEASWPVASGRREECRKCGHQESVTAGTLFHQTKKPLRLWFRAITLWVTSKRGLSAKEMSRLLGIHYETAWTWCHKLRSSVGAAFGAQGAKPRGKEGSRRGRRRSPCDEDAPPFSTGSGAPRGC